MRKSGYFGIAEVKTVKETLNKLIMEEYYFPWQIFLWMEQPSAGNDVCKHLNL
jgi:hypothetical protein